MRLLVVYLKMVKKRKKELTKGRRWCMWWIENKQHLDLLNLVTTWVEILEKDML